MNARHIQLLTVICEIHQFHLNFVVFTCWSSSCAHWRFVFNK